MIPIQKLKSRNLTLGQRGWLRWQLWHLGWFETVRVVKSSKRYTPNHHVVWQRREDQIRHRWLPRFSLLSAAKAAGIKYVPAI